MKFLRILPLFILTLLASCTSEDASNEPSKDIIIDEVAQLTKFKEVSNDTHAIELYSHTGSLQQGYNEIHLRIKDKTTNKYVENAEITWTPVMHMTSMSHSCPYSEVEKAEDMKTLYEGFIVFQMAQNDTEYWDLKIDYTISGTAYTATTVIDVPASAKQRVTTFKGTDNVKYILAYMEPHHPKVGQNELTVGVFKMENMMIFPAVDNYTVKIDPRMPSMGNHGSPNNTDLVQNPSDSFYQGNMNLTMTGLWRINLQLLNASNEVLKGETITEAVPESSIYFELEF